jgi:hypothetical protein
MRFILLATALAFITCCKKTDTNPLDSELAKLPPITQTGANTFGCLVNGKAVTPNSSCINCPPPLEGGYDPSPNGQFGLRCRYENGKKSIGFGLDSIFTYKNFLIKDTINKKVRVSIYNELLGNSCEWVGSLDPFQLISGNVTLSKVDVPNGIFSGTFEFTIKTKDCGNYEVTNGRFDYKF